MSKIKKLEDLKIYEDMSINDMSSLNQVLGGAPGTTPTSFSTCDCTGNYGDLGYDYCTDKDTDYK